MPDRQRIDRPLRERIHEIIFGSHTPSGLTFDILLLVAIVCSVIALSLETVGWVNTRCATQLEFAKWAFTIMFTIEYVLRIYCVKRPLKYIFSFWGIVDLLAILPDYVLLVLGWGGMATKVNSHAFSVIRSIRLLRVFRILNLSWFQYEAEDLGNAIWSARGKITVFLMVVMIIVTVSGTIMFELESTFAPKTVVDGVEVSSSDFTSIPNGIYWAIVTMTTVGFGDIVPVTSAGKIVSAILILVGYSLIIVPTGFVSAEVIESRLKKVTAISCPTCVTEGHDTDAIFCKYCGEKL